MNNNNNHSRTNSATIFKKRKRKKALLGTSRSFLYIYLRTHSNAFATHFLLACLKSEVLANYYAVPGKRFLECVLLRVCKWVLHLLLILLCKLPCQGLFSQKLHNVAIRMNAGISGWRPLQINTFASLEDWSLSISVRMGTTCFYS